MTWKVREGGGGFFILNLLINFVELFLCSMFLNQF